MSYNTIIENGWNYGINASGEGFGQSAFGEEFVLWSPTGQATVLQTDGYGSSADAINNAEEIVGALQLSGYWEAVEWSPTGTVTFLPGVNGSYESGAGAINNVGEILGYSRWSTTATGYAYMLWSPTGQTTLLQDPGGPSYSAGAINDVGESVGSCETGGPRESEAVEWSLTGTATVLSSPGNLDSVRANAISNTGYVIGWAGTQNVSGVEAVEWSPTGQATILMGPCGFSQPEAVNGTGEVAGESYGKFNDKTGEFIYHSEAMRWSPSGQATVLRNPLGGPSQALAINNAGNTVGFGINSSHTVEDALLWSPSGKVTNLNTILGTAWTDTEAVGIKKLAESHEKQDMHTPCVTARLVVVVHLSSESTRARIDNFLVVNRTI